MQRILNLFKSSDARINRSYLQMLFSLLIKLSGMLISFFSVPLIIGFVDYKEYGIFLALTSSFALINVMDIGLGDGLRNKFAESKSTGNYADAKTYVSTSYFINFLFSALIILLYFLFENRIDWGYLLNLPAAKAGELQLIGRILIVATSVQFFLQAFLNVLKGDQQYITYSIITLVLNLLSVSGIVFYLVCGTRGSLLELVVSFFVVPNAALLLISIFYFATRYKTVRPSISHIKPDKLKGLAALSLQFFIINIMGVISLQFINLLVINAFSANAVVDFNLLFRYYFLPISFAYILFNPIWSTFTEAFVTRDVEWIRKLLNKSIRIALLMIIVLPLMLLIANPFISIWSHTTYQSDWDTNTLFVIWTALTILSEPYKMFVKGSGQLNGYLLWSLLFTAIQVVLSILLVVYFNWTINGILLGCISSQGLYLLFFIGKSRQLIRELGTEKSSNDQPV